MDKEIVLKIVVDTGEKFDIRIHFPALRKTKVPATIFRREADFERPMLLFLRSSLLIVLTLSLGGCFIWPFKVAEELDVEVIDATSGTPVPYAEIVKVACDVHNFSCRRASSSERERMIRGRSMLIAQGDGEHGFLLQENFLY